MATLKQNTTIEGKEIYKRGNTPGTILMYAGPPNKVPEGYLVCNGSTYDTTMYPDLYNAIRDKFGNNLPDLRGLFVMGVSNENATGTIKDDEFPSHTHRYSVNSTKSKYYGASNTYSKSSNSTTTYTSGATGGSETRPKNVALLYIIATGRPML